MGLFRVDCNRVSGFSGWNGVGLDGVFGSRME